MKRFCAILGITIAAVAVAAAQNTEDRTYQLNYYSNRNNGAGSEQFVRIINPGTQGSPLSAGHGAICADIYVFDANQEMIECCHCPITANGLLELSVLKNLTQNPLTGFPAANSGAIKLVADNRLNCDETSPAPVNELLGWATHVQQPIAGTLVTTETEFLAAPMGSAEFTFLAQACTFVEFLGSGKGICNCGSGSA